MKITDMSNENDIPNYYLLLKKQVIEPILKKNGVVWIRQLENKIIHIVETGNRTVVVNDFLVSQLACFYYLIDDWREGIQLVESVIKASKLRYEFAEKILERMTG